MTQSSVDFEHHLTELGLNMEEVEVGPGSPWLDRTVGEVGVESAGSLLVVAVLRKGGGTEMNPAAAFKLSLGDAFVVVRRAGA